MSNFWKRPGMALVKWPRWRRRREGHRVCRKRVVRLMSKMGFMPIHQKPSTSDPHPGHKIYERAKNNRPWSHLVC